MKWRRRKRTSILLSIGLTCVVLFVGMLLLLAVLHEPKHRTQTVASTTDFQLRTQPHVVASTTNATSTASKTLSAEPSGYVTASSAAVTVTHPNVTGSATQAWWGVYAGDSPEDAHVFEQLVGKQANLVVLFWAFGDEFPTYYSDMIGARGQTLVLFWEPDTHYQAIIDGKLDASIAAFAEGAHRYGYPVILVPFNEMNLNETVWGYGQLGNTPQKFVEAWRHIHDFFVGVNNVQFGLAYNNVSIPDVPDNAFDRYYPGDAYVDIVGVDGFNFGDPWVSFDDTFNESLVALTVYGKPIMLFSLASTPGPSRPAWIRDGLGSVMDQFPSIIGWTWFNVRKERDWRVQADSASLDAFRAVVF